MCNFLCIFLSLGWPITCIHGDLVQRALNGNFAWVQVSVCPSLERSKDFVKTFLIESTMNLMFLPVPNMFFPRTGRCLGPTSENVQAKSDQLLNFVSLWANKVGSSLHNKCSLLQFYLSLCEVFVVNDSFLTRNFDTCTN